MIIINLILAFAIGLFVFLGFMELDHLDAGMWFGAAIMWACLFFGREK